MKRFALIALIAATTLALLVGCSGNSGSSSKESATQSASSSTEQAGNTFKQIDAQAAMDMMEAESDYVILDVRTEVEYASGHIPGAINIPVESIGSDEITELPDKDQLIMVYCRSGNRSKQAAGQLVVNGYTNVVEFGGILDWPGEVTTD